MMVVILGPDGSGKSSVIEGIQSSLSDIFQSFHVFHLSFPLKGNTTIPSRTANASEPHADKPYSLVVSLVKLLYFVLRYNLGYWRFGSKILSSNHLIILDRYYHDVLVDPKRFRYGGPLWCARLIEKLIPRPQLYLLLDAPAEVLQTRKQEVSFEETARQRQVYLDVMTDLPNAVVVDASQPMPQVILAVIETLRHCHHQCWPDKNEATA